MTEKLTLRLDHDLIEKAKRYSREHGKSVSRLVADYFAVLDEAQRDQRPLPPLTAKLRGALRGRAVSEEDYREHLRRKHLED